VVVSAAALSGCALSSHAGRAAPRVLGQVDGTPLVVGKPAPDGTGQLGAVSCPSARRCWAVGVAGPDPSAAATGAASPAVIVASADGGNTWRAEHVTGGSTPQLSAVSCPTSARCMAVGSNGSSLPGGGVVVTTTDAGQTWAPATAPGNVLALVGVACQGPTACTAIVNSGTSTWSAQSTDFGLSWHQEGNLPANFQSGNDLTCVPSGTCLVAGYVPTSNGHGQGAIAVSTDGGRSWALATVPPDAGVLRSAACPSTTSCLAAGSTSTTVSDVVPAKGELLRSRDGGHTWSASARTAPVEDTYGLACPSAELCAMVGTYWVGYPAAAAGAVAQSGDGGATFRLSEAAYIPTTLAGLSCPDTTVCVAVGGRTVARITLVTPRPAPRATSTPGTESHTPSATG